MPTISRLHARQILDSRGNPTVEVDCALDNGAFGRAAVPSGASTGSHEAVELRDGDKNVYGGKGVLKAVANVNGPIAKKLVGEDIISQRFIDEVLVTLDGTTNKGKLGANALLGTSMAICRARAASEKISLYRSLAEQFDQKPPSNMPVPLMNVLNGGAHADSGLSFQECMVVPVDFPNFSEALRAGAEIFHALKAILKKGGHVTAVGDEGGFAPHLKNGDEAFTLLEQAIKEAGYTDRVKLAIDCAASEFYKDGVYMLDGKKHTSEELTAYYEGLVKKHPIVSIEDSHFEDDWAGFAAMQAAIGKTVQLVGDDLFVTNVKRLEEGIEKKAANAILIKLNQIGTVSETVDAIVAAREAGWNSIASHRSGETEDAFIAHLAVALGTGQIKTGSLSRTDRVCKYNELLRIEEELGPNARYINPFR